MNFDLTEEQKLMQETVRRFLGDFLITERHSQRAAPGGYPRARWQQVADLGLLALTAPEAMGGMDGSMVDLVLVAEALGAGVAPDPWLENGVLPIRLLSAAGDTESMDNLLSGNSIMATAFAEPGGGYDLLPSKTTIAKDGRVSGTKTLVPGAAIADQLLLIGQQDNAPALALLPAAASDAVNRQDYSIVDGSTASQIEFNGATSTVHPLDETALQQIVGDIRLLAAAEMVGLAQRLLDDTTAYVKERHQFGVAIGSFQAVQHRLVDCFTALEQARSMVLRCALQSADSHGADWARLNAGSKAFAGEAAMAIAFEAVQLHGGMGQTDELAVSHAFKRILFLDKLFGDQGHCLRQYARAA